MFILTHDVIVCDEEFKSASDTISKALEKLDRLFSDYVKELDDISRNGTIEGNRGKALNQYAREASGVRDAIQKIAQYHTKTTRCFLQDVDEADEALY